MSIVTILATIRAINALLPILRDVVSQVESLFPQRGFGAAKLEIAKGIIEKSISSIGIAETTFDSVWPALENAIGVIVATEKAAK